MVSSAAGGTALAILSLVTEVLESVDRGAGGRLSLCASVADAFGCHSSAHALLGARATLWSICLWRAAPQGTRTVTLSVRDDELSKRMRPGGPGMMWASGPAQALLLGWLAAPYLAEIPLRVEDDRASLLVLGRDAVFGGEDARLLNDVRRPLRAAEGLIIRLEPPVPHGSIAPAGPGLTERELQVLSMLREGLLARSIAQRMAVSERTVHKHLGNVYRKLDVHDRLLAVRRGEQLGLLVPADPTTRAVAEVG